MKILYFTRGWTGHDERFARAYIKHDVELGVVTLQAIAAPRHSATTLSKLKFVRTLSMQNLPDEALARKAAELFSEFEREFSPDIVVAGPLTDCAYIKAISSSGVHWVAQSWAFDLYWEAERSLELSRRCQVALKACTNLFADCRDVVSKCSKARGIPFYDAYVMPWGLEASPGTRLETGGIRQELGLTEKYVFVHSRGLEPIYSIETLLTAFRDVHEVVPKTVLLLASEGSLKPLVHDFTRRHRLEGAVVLLGQIPHEKLLSLFRDADCYVSCAASDGTSVSMLEAMNARLPVILSDAGGNSEWVQDGQNGWLTPVGDSGKLRQALVDAVNLEKSRRDRCIEQNYRLVQNKANWSKNYRAFLSFLRSCASC